MRKKSQQDRGGIVEIEAPIHISNVMIVCKKCGETRMDTKLTAARKSVYAASVGKHCDE